MRHNVLVVDDNRLILTMIQDMLKAEGLNVYVAESAEDSLETLLNNEIAVVVSDNVMPGMSGLEFLAELKSFSPDTVKIMMSAYADLNSALAAINSSEVFRFVVKPIDEAEMMAAVREGVKRYETLLELRREDENVLLSLAQTIELKDPSTRGHCDRVAGYAGLIASAMQLPRILQREIKYGSWLHDCGKIGIPESILNGCHFLSDEEFAHVKMHSEWGADVAEKAKLSSTAYNVIRHHHERFDGNGYPEGLSGDAIPIEARIVSVADVYDALVTDRPYRKKLSHDVASQQITEMAGTYFDPEIVAIFLKQLSDRPAEASADGGAPGQTAAVKVQTLAGRPTIR